MGKNKSAKDFFEEFKKFTANEPFVAEKTLSDIEMLLSTAFLARDPLKELVDEKLKCLSNKKQNNQ
jgi:hypothetical protein